MSGSYLLDTNIVIGLLNSEISILEKLAIAPEVFTSSITVGELCYGARKSSRATVNLQRIEEFIAAITVLSCDAETGRRYAEIKDNLRRQGRPIPENDIWIAALAVQHDLILVSRDSDFRSVNELKLESW